MEECFNTPVVLFTFKRKDNSVRIIERIAQVRPKKLYILSDQGRDEEEKLLVEECRKAVENAINWPCQVIKDYAETNRGVYQNIGLGAKRVFDKEACAIFLEDDNLPEITFFRYCEEMLTKYWDDERVLWVCGTNYLGDYDPGDGEDYKFTQHLLPCGWASWSHKFVPYYDGELTLLDDPKAVKALRKRFESGAFYRMYRDYWYAEKKRITEGKKPVSWDYQMCLTLRANDMLGVVPMKNQIKNIGVDDFSIHGGTTMQNVMTMRFCGMDSYPLSFPLNGPEKTEKDPAFERTLGKIILPPFQLRMRSFLGKKIKKILGLSEETSLRQLLRR